MTALLEVRDLRVSYGDVPAVSGISFDVAAGEAVALVGESGSGKTATALAVMRLLGETGRIGRESGIRFDGIDLLAQSESQMRSIRGRCMSMVFQEPALALNPAMRVGHQVAEVALVHGERSRHAAWAAAVTMLERVGIPDAGARARLFPHELSGGMRQRVMIAMALLLKPSLVIADEPTSSLDVTVQAQVLAMLSQLQRDFGTAVLLITHDLGVVAELGSRLMVMRVGRLVEEGLTRNVFAEPAHEYTAELIAAVPRLT